MEIVTFFGITWRIPSHTELYIALVIIILLATLYFLIRYSRHLDTLKKHEEQFLLFKAKHLGLTSFQFKVLRGITEMLKLKKATDILSHPDLFEKTISPFLDYITALEKDPESMERICRDIVITYEKLYHGSKPRKPLTSAAEFDVGMLFFFTSAGGSAFICRLEEKTAEALSLFVLKSATAGSELPKGCSIKAGVWRAGDAEYSFSSTITSDACVGCVITITIPEALERFNEIRQPFIEVIIPCTVGIKPSNPEENPVMVDSTLEKLNTHEVVVKSSFRMDFHHTYALSFTISDFLIQADVKLLADRTVTSENVFFYTFRFTAMSKVAMNVLKNFVLDHL